MKKNSGQVAILFALVFTFLFVLFGFVVDFGHLVNTKINLQIAADSAAYAGAAWQARLLDKIAVVNYRMRQDVKEFAMRVNVTHLRHNRGFPRGSQFINGPAQAPGMEDPWVCQQAHGYTAISGLRYAQDTNLCRNASPSTGGLPPIVVPPVIASFDPFAVAIAAQIRRIQQAANQECRAAANDNRILVDHLIDVYTRRSQFHANQVRLLSDYVNQIVQENPSDSSHPAVRTAMESARRNLAMANRDDFRMEILQPEGGELIRLEEQRLNGTLFYLNFQVAGDGCVGQPGFENFDDMIAGFNKTQSIVTYFAVKLTSRPQMLFMPEKWAEAAFPKLEAFAAAKPFGSRIGPDTSADQRLPVPNRPGTNNRMLNFSMIPNDQLGIMNTKLMALLDSLHPFNGVGRPQGNQQTGWPDPDRPQDLRTPLAIVRAPNVFDSMFFTVFPDPNHTDDYLEPQYASALFPDYTEAGDPASNSVIDIPDTRTPAYLPSGVGSRNKGQGWIQENADATGTSGPYAGYAEEKVGSHSIKSAIGAGGVVTTGNAADFGFATPDMIHSAWSPEGKPGRIGYSVKFIGMDALTRTLRVRLNDSGTEGPIANPPTGDDNIKNIYH
ncbi:MAG: pilus assembly protein [Deltaproteobacteria bacterium]|nr:pilus assembly protein [Deltaproteobacteria bacterium]MBI3296135.1 pilus assembly protein [Deltaproteobacteria bacterium]